MERGEKRGLEEAQRDVKTGTNQLRMGRLGSVNYKKVMNSHRSSQGRTREREGDLEDGGSDCKDEARKLCQPEKM